MLTENPASCRAVRPMKATSYLTFGGDIPREVGGQATAKFEKALKNALRYAPAAICLRLDGPWRLKLFLAATGSQQPRPAL